MKANLDDLKVEIQDFLSTEGLIVFHGFSRVLDGESVIYWDCERYPEFRDFISAARAAGAKMIVFHDRQFSSDQIDEALDRLQACEVPRDEYRTIERRMNELRGYDGFTCTIELSFDIDGHVYLFDLRTDWFEELTELLDEIDMFAAGPDEEDDSPISGYFSKN